jgi:hypothetical protein
MSLVRPALARCAPPIVATLILHAGAAHAGDAVTLVDPGPIISFEAYSADVVSVLKNVAGTNGGLYREAPDWWHSSLADFGIKAFHSKGDGTYYVLRPNNELERVIPNPRRVTHLGWNVVDFQPLDGATVVVKDTSSAVYLLNPAAPFAMSGTEHGVAQFQWAYFVYALKNDGNLWLNIAGEPDQWVDGNALSFQVVSDVNDTGIVIYVLGSDRKLWRERFGWQQRGRTLVDANVASFRALDDSEVFVTGTDGKTWREIGTWRTRTFLGAGWVTYQPVRGEFIFFETRDGKLWRYDLGPR